MRGGGLWSVLLRLYPALIPVLLCGFSSNASHENIIKVSAALTDSLRERAEQAKGKRGSRHTEKHAEK